MIKNEYDSNNSNKEKFDDFCLLNNFDYYQEEVSEMCKECKINLIQCDICEGYFEINFYYQKHEKICPEIFKTYKDSENLLECKECKSFIKFDQFEDHKKLCEKFNNEKLECSFCQNLFSHGVIEDHQKICQILLSEIMLMKETIECSFCQEKLSIVNIHSHEKKCEKLKEKQEQIEAQIDLIPVDFPRHWGTDAESIEVIDDNLSIAKLLATSEEYLYVTDLMKLSVPSVKFNNIFRIENKNIWIKYSKERAKIIEEKKEAQENMLFHGTRSNNPKSLYTLGFDISFSSDQGSYGRGIYFARQAKYSYPGYCYFELQNNKGYIFLAKVTTGKAFDYSKNYDLERGRKLRKPPLLDESKFIYYDSVTSCNNKGNQHLEQMYVIYENDKAYPYYLIEFDATNFKKN